MIYSLFRTGQRDAVHVERIAVRDHVRCVAGEARNIAVAGQCPRAVGVESHKDRADLGRDGIARLRAERWRALTVPRTVIHYAPFESHA